MILSIFSYAYFPSAYLFEMISSIFWLDCSFCYCWILQILWILWSSVPFIRYVTSFANVFFLVYGLLSFFWQLLLQSKKLNFSEVELIIFFSLGICLWCVFEKSSFPRLPRIYLMLSFNSVLVFFYFIFRSVIHFELIFMKDVMSVFRFTFVHVDVQ